MKGLAHYLYHCLSSTNDTITVTFSESVFRSRSASGTGLPAAEIFRSVILPFPLRVVATLGSNTPTFIQKMEMPTLGINYIGLPNGSEVLTVTPVQDQIYDAKGNIATTSQSNNTRTFNAKRSVLQRA